MIKAAAKADLIDEYGVVVRERGVHLPRGRGHPDHLLCARAGGRDPERGYRLMTRSEEWFERAQKVLPRRGQLARARVPRGGRQAALCRQGPGQSRAGRGRAGRITDYVGSWGPMVLGHGHPDILKAVYDRMVCGLYLRRADRPRGRDAPKR